MKLGLERRYSTQLVVFVLICLFSATAIAAKTSYQCTIQTALEPGENGEPAAISLGKIGSTDFAVDRNTGRVIGSILDNGDFSYEIVNAGGKSRSFIVITTTHIAVELIRVKDYAESFYKPFVAIDYLGVVYFGLCK